MISSVAEMYEIHPQTLRLYEREGLLKPSRTDGNTRLYTDEDLERLEFILNLARDLGVNIAGIAIILQMRERMEEMNRQMQNFVEYVRSEMLTRFQQASPGAAGAIVPMRKPSVQRPVVVTGAGQSRSGIRRMLTLSRTSRIRPDHFYRVTPWSWGGAGSCGSGGRLFRNWIIALGSRPRSACSNHCTVRSRGSRNTLRRFSSRIIPSTRFFSARGRRTTPVSKLRGGWRRAIRRLRSGFSLPANLLISMPRSAPWN